MSAIRGTIARFSSLADGTLRYVIDVSPADDRHEFHQVHSSVALALLNDEAGVKPVDHPSPRQGASPRTPRAPRPHHPYGKQAQELRRVGFCRVPDVWRAVGTDAEFLAWIRTQPCVLAGGGAGPCHGDVIAAHVRRIANGAGTGIKPAYSAVPLCDHHHRLQHAHGEAALAPKEQWDEWRVEYAEEWAWGAIKADLGYESMGDVPPAVLTAWAERHGVQKYLPKGYA